jgi:thiosulfate reductase cytochrome b subunit
MLKGFLVGFHLVIGTTLCIVGMVVLNDYWKTPALTLLAGGVFAISIGAGMLAKKRWVQWLVGLQLLISTLIAVFLLAGSIIWHESAGLIILLIYGLFLLVELLTWHQIRLLASCSSGCAEARR